MTLEQFVKVGNHSQEENFELLKGLADLIAEGTYSNLSPECIEVGENCSVEIRTDLKSENAYFMAPEQIFQGKNADRGTALFSFGMLFYYMINGQNWYTANAVHIYEAREKDVTMQINSGDRPEINHLVSWNSEERESGYDAFLSLYQSFPKGKLLIEYRAGDSTVLTEEIHIGEDIPEYAKGKKFKAVDRNIYLVETEAALSSKLIEQHVIIPVVLFKKAEDVIREICYQAEFKGTRRELIKAVEYDGLDCQFDVPVDTIREDKIIFLMTCAKVSDAGNEKEGQSKRVYTVKRIGQVPLSYRLGKVVLRVSVLSNQSSLVVSLYNQSKTRRLISRDLLFDI